MELLIDINYSGIKMANSVTLKAMTEEIILNKASFNPKVKTYIFFMVLFTLIMSFIGWVLVPFWIFGLGQFLSKKYYHTLMCELSNKNLRFSKGMIVQIEKTIPLENIQDLSFIGGPILRYFSLAMIKVETAGGGGQHNQNLMSIIGINNAEGFKKEILDQREKVIREKSGFVQSMPAAAPVAKTTDEIQLLIEIKNELVEIKKALVTRQ